MTEQQPATGKTTAETTGDTTRTPPTPEQAPGQSPEQVVSTPVGGDDLDRELQRAGRGPGKVTTGLGAGTLVLVAFFAGVWAHSAVADSGGGTAATIPGGRGGQVFGPGGGPGGGQGGQGGQPGGGPVVRGGGTTGTVSRVEGGTVYVKTQDGTEVKVTTSDSTRVETAQQGALADLTPGSSVTVQGQRGPDGVQAQVITKRAQ